MSRPLTDPRALGAAVRDARKRAGWTQADLAQRSAVSRQFVIGLERGANPGAELQRVLAVLRALGLAVSLLPVSTSELARSSDVSALLDDVLDPGSG